MKAASRFQGTAAFISFRKRSLLSTFFFHPIAKKGSVDSSHPSFLKNPEKGRVVQSFLKA
jgi:hypothetical protein